MLRLIGETQGSIETPPAFDKKSQKYLMDTVTSMSASYQLTLENKKATKQRLADFLGFAKQFDLSDATVDAVLPFMETETSGGKVDFGDVAANYRVQFVDQAIVRIFGVTTPESTVRNVMRLVTVGSLVTDEGLADIGWAYFTQAVFDTWRSEGAQFTNVVTSRQFPVDPSPFSSIPSPGTVVLNRPQISILANFFRNEDSLVAAVMGLQTLVQSSTKLDPSAFASKMKAFGDSFSLIDKGMRTNAMFSVFDKLIALTQSPAEARGSSLNLLSTIKPNPTRTKVFLQVPSLQPGGE
jgi:predicted nucleotidyltransferase